jgi:DNA-binding HxlR family transcriptional regulator
MRCRTVDPIRRRRCCEGLIESKGGHSCLPIPGISQRVLTATLRGLERDGLVKRTVHPVVPPRVDYELTPLGLTLLETVWSLVNWATEHMDDVDKARVAYDEARDTP